MVDPPPALVDPNGDLVPVHGGAALLAVFYLVVSPVVVVIAVVDGNYWRTPRALWFLLVGVGAAIWLIREAPAWRRLTPSVLRDLRPPRPLPDPSTSVLARFREGLEDTLADDDEDEEADEDDEEADGCGVLSALVAVILVALVVVAVLRVVF